MEMNALEIVTIQKDVKSKWPKYTAEYQGKTITVNCNMDFSWMSWIRPERARLVSDVVDQLKKYDYSKYKYAPGRDSFDDLPKADEAEFAAAKEKFISVLNRISEKNFVKYVVLNAISKKDGALYKKRSLHLATFPYTNDYCYYELIAYNQTDSSIEIKLDKKDMIFCPNEDEFTLLKLNILPLENIDFLLNMIESGYAPAAPESKKQVQPNAKTKQDAASDLPLFEVENGTLNKVNFNSRDKSAKQYLTEISSYEDIKTYRLTIPSFIAAIGDDAVCQTNDKCRYEIDFEGNTQRIGNRAFLNCNVFQVKLPNSISFIGKQAFKNSFISTLYEIPQQVKEIEEEAFSESGVRHFALHSDVKRIKKGAFKNCKSLSASIYDGKGFVIPNGVLAIESEAFSGCESMGNVTISATVTEIADDAFDRCPKLEISAPIGSVAHQFALSHNIPFLELPEEEFEVNKDKLVAYHGLNSSVTLPGNIKTIGKYALRYEMARNIVISDGVEKILEKAFIGCSSLKSVTLPDSLKEIGTKAFTSCASLEKISLPYGLKQIGWSAFCGCNKLTEIDIPETVETIDKDAFLTLRSLRKVVIRGQNTVLGEWAIGAIPGLVIVAPKDSPAEQYAKKHCIKFEKL